MDLNLPECTTGPLRFMEVTKKKQLARPQGWGLLMERINFWIRVGSSVHYTAGSFRGHGIEVPDPRYIFPQPSVCNRGPAGPVSKVSSNLEEITAEIGSSLAERALDRAISGRFEVRYPSHNEEYEAAERRAELQSLTFAPTSVMPDKFSSLAKVSGWLNY